MIRLHYPRLFPGRKDIAALAAKTMELTEYLAARKDFAPKGRIKAHAAYHDSCSSLREVEVEAAPRQLLAKLEGLKLSNLAAARACCGFGGTFCVKYPEISARMAAEKCADVAATGADLLLGNDLGCLLHLAGKLKRDGAATRVRHLAEVLAGDPMTPAIGEGEA
jgi:L-lactate dehydrogenase complex protein LldE